MYEVYGAQCPGQRRVLRRVYDLHVGVLEDTWEDNKVNGEISTGATVLESFIISPLIVGIIKWHPVGRLLNSVESIMTCTSCCVNHII